MDINELVLPKAALDAIDNGAWVPAGDSAPDVRFKVIGFMSEEAQKYTKNKQAALRTANKGKPLDSDQELEVIKQALADVCLKDWEGITQNGEAVPYSKELAKEWIMSRAGDKFTSLVLLAVKKLDNNANAYVEEVSKNS